MSQFYVSIIFIGVVLILAAFIWIAYDKKKTMDYSRKLDEKRNELIEIVNDADQMIEELNKFSDYIVTQLDLKNEELNSSIKKYEEKIREINKEIKEISAPKTGGIVSERVVNGSPAEAYIIKGSSIYRRGGYSTEPVIDSSEQDHAENLYKVNSKTHDRAKDKVIPINTKYKDVIQLYQDGLDETEIAKRLNIGKGEIQLILELNRKD